jgi:CheY-like chemotaxis protein
MTKKIMLVDDRENIRTVLGDIFESLGYMVIKASTGEEALDMIDKEMPNLVLLDTELNTIVPNGMFGFEVCRQIKQVKKLPIKVIIYTGTLGMVDALKARQMGADDYIIKGEDPEILIKSVEELIGHANDENK